MKSLRLMLRLVTSRVLRFPARALITVFGIMAATAAVLWVVSGFDALMAQFDENAHKYLGRYDALVVMQPQRSGQSFVPDNLIAQLNHAPAILEANPVAQSRVSVFNPQKQTFDNKVADLIGGDRPPVNGAPPLDPTLVATSATESPYEIEVGRWLPTDNSLVAVMGEHSARTLDVGVGDTIRITSFANQLELSIVGLVDQPTDSPSFAPRRGGGSIGAIRNPSPSRRQRSATSRGGANRPQVKETPERSGEGASRVATDDNSNHLTIPGGRSSGIATHAIYVTPSVAEMINGYKFKPNVVQLVFREGSSANDFATAWSEKLAKANPAMKLVDFQDVRKGLSASRNFGNQKSQAWMAASMASLAAVFIIFSTLSMGVSERAKELAILRAIALTRRQVLSLFFIESILLAAIGWACGLLAGWTLLSVGSRFLPQLFTSSATPGLTGVVYSAIAVTVGAVAAAILPAWRATRIRPIDALPDTQIQTLNRAPWIIAGIVGLALIAIAPTLIFSPLLASSEKTFFYSIIAYPLIFVGMLLITPLAIILCEQLIAPKAAWLFGLNANFVRNQLSSNMWRTLGATIAISIGLWLYTATQTWGYSMLQPFLPGKWMPDGLVGFQPLGLKEKQFDLLRQVDGIRNHQVHPLAVEQTKFDWDRERYPDVQGDNAIVIGVDADSMFGGSNPFMDIQFVDTNRDEAISRLQSSQSCLIAESFHIKSGLGIGDKVSFKPPNAPNEKVDYEIVGFVSLPGWHWLSKFSGLRRHFVRTDTMIFAGRSQVRNDFHQTRTEFFWFDLEPAASSESVADSLQYIAESTPVESFRSGKLGQVMTYRPFARTTFSSTVRRSIASRADGVIWGMSYLPLITLVIMSLAIANAVLASVKARTWEFGVLRSIGVTRWQLVRLVILEAMLIGLAASVISLSCGLITGWCGVGLAKFAMWFAGQPPLHVPWSALATGFGLTLLLCLMAAVLPALRTGLAEPLTLLKHGQ